MPYKYVDLLNEWISVLLKLSSALSNYSLTANMPDFEKEIMWMIKTLLMRIFFNSDAYSVFAS